MLKDQETVDQSFHSWRVGFEGSQDTTTVAVEAVRPQLADLELSSSSAYISGFLEYQLPEYGNFTVFGHWQYVSVSLTDAAPHLSVDLRSTSQLQQQQYLWWGKYLYLKYLRMCSSKSIHKNISDFMRNTDLTNQIMRKYTNRISLSHLCSVCGKCLQLRCQWPSCLPSIINESTSDVRKPRNQIPLLPSIRWWYEEPTENHSQLSWQSGTPQINMQIWVQECKKLMTWNCISGSLDPTKSS